MTFINLLAILFIGLKLAAIIEWPWLLVLSPLYPGLVVLFVFIVAAVMQSLKANKK